MVKKFSSPRNKEEFLKQAEQVESKAALSMLNALRTRRDSVIRALEPEIKFYEKVVELRKNGDVDWPTAKELKEQEGNK